MMAYREDPDPKNESDKNPLVFCINCKYMDKNGFSEIRYTKYWFCKSPEVIKRNPQTGDLYSSLYCCDKNKDGICKDYEEKEKKKETIPDEPKKSWLQKLFFF